MSTVPPPLVRTESETGLNAALTATDETRAIVQLTAVPEQGGAQLIKAGFQPAKLVRTAGRAVSVTDLVPVGKANVQYVLHSPISLPAGDISTEAW
jgi:hypothetical protein